MAYGGNRAVYVIIWYQSNYFRNEKEIGFEWVYKPRNGLVGMGL